MLGNTLGTNWEPDENPLGELRGNIMGTHWKPNLKPDCQLFWLRFPSLLCSGPLYLLCDICFLMQVKQLLAILSKKSCMEVVCVIQVATFFFSFVVQLLIVPTQSPLSGRRSTYNIRMCMKLDLVFKEGRRGGDRPSFGTKSCWQFQVCARN
jgi:hypothetical protein